MIALKIYNENKFIGYFSFNSIEFSIFKKDKFKNKINSFRPLKQELYVFNDEDLFNGVVKDYVKELTTLFKNNNLYLNYSVKVIKFNKQEMIYEYH